MSEKSSLSLFAEGVVSLPDGYQDRTVNVFTGPSAGTPAFNISRDTMDTGETLPAYVDRQLALMQKHLSGWNQSGRRTVMLGEDLLQGEQVNASYRREGKSVWQQQAVFNTRDSYILVFTMSSLEELKDGDNHLFSELLRSFRFHN
ncbi:DUF1795 domain-containing protein [Pantoea sp. B623]|uniref:DUF1795 domain-containing protein n=1 Tax=Pantoea sp. B623 TaxID=2974561 RepID=UPI00216A057A|nr:DUF1795 domain-containing protein [Pantoea sp. B623]MCS4492701.1 DUF1795 domain-containing protein [Pantoea sp. B623]